MKRKIQGMIGIAGLLALLPVCGPAQAVLRAEPLKTVPREQFVADAVQMVAARQDTETFPFAGQALAAKWSPVDIKAQCNMNLYAGAGPKCPVVFTFMTLGRRVLYGVPFDIVDPATNKGLSVIALCSSMLQARDLTDTATIPVGRKLKMVYALMTAYYAAKDGDQCMRLDYADGTSHVFPIKGKADVDDWYHAYTRIYSDTTKAVVVPAVKDSRTQFHNLHVVQWENPSPEKMIKSITFKSDRNAMMALFVAGVTGYAAE